MELRGALEKLNKDEIVAIGAKDGHSFIYFGPAGDIKTIEKLFNNHLTRMKGQCTRHLGILANLLEKPLVKEDCEDGYEEYLADVADVAAAISERWKRYDATKQYVNNFVPAMERAVVEQYRKEVDDCWAILVEGIEQGEFWTRDEFIKKFKK